MEILDKKKDVRATIKVCLGGKCRLKEAEKIYTNLKEGLEKDEAIVLPINGCLGYCAEGPIIVINDNIVKGVKPFLAVEQVRKELADPSCKADGLGVKSIDELDDMLDTIDKL
ncbi:MAG: (2Fe-2S) ferredoxin domain-containing protein [Candidatus Moranbacteria bacterium]|nr:(2Fe-2S) ferredoxin domain-containing protein [Candidatus Moranbacteria bacterium]